MSNYLVTGYTGQEVTAKLDAHMHAAMVGGSSYVSTLGSQLAASAVDANTIRLAAGALFFQGLFACIPTGQYVDVPIESGTQGQKRNDLIGFRYTKNTTTGAELGEFVAIKGTPVTGTPSDPAYTGGNILGGDTAGFMPLYRIPISGITVGTPVALYTTVYPTADLESCESQTYTSFDGGAVQDSNVTVTKKGGLCFVRGTLAITNTLSDWVNILDSTKVPAPQHGVGLYDTVDQWGTSYTRPLRIGVGAGGSLRIEYGQAGTYSFVLPPYPIA